MKNTKKFMKLNDADPKADPNDNHLMDNGGESQNIDSQNEHHYIQMDSLDDLIPLPNYIDFAPRSVISSVIPPPILYTEKIKSIEKCDYCRGLGVGGFQTSRIVE